MYSQIQVLILFLILETASIPSDNDELPYNRSLAGTQVGDLSANPQNVGNIPESSEKNDPLCIEETSKQVKIIASRRIAAANFDTCKFIYSLLIF